MRLAELETLRQRLHKLFNVLACKDGSLSQVEGLKATLTEDL